MYKRHRLAFKKHYKKKIALLLSTDIATVGLLLYVLHYFYTAVCLESFDLYSDRAMLDWYPVYVEEKVDEITDWEIGVPDI